MASRPTSLRRALLGVAAVLVLPLALALAGLLAMQWRQQRDRALDDLQVQARALRHAMDRELALDITVLNALAASRDIDRGNLAEFHAAARRTAQVRPGSWVILVDATGQNLLNTARPYGTPLPNLRRSLAQPGTVQWQGRELPLPSLAIFDDPLRTGEPAFSGLVYGRLSQRPVVATNVAVARDGRPTHVLGMAYGADFFVEVLRGQPLPPEGIASVLDGTGRVVARNRANERFVGRTAPPPFAHGTRDLPAEGMGATVSMEGAPTDYAYSRSRVNDWVAVVGLERSVLLVPAQRALWTSAAAVLGAALVAGLLALRLARRIDRPLATLAERVPAADARYDDVRDSGIAEVEALKRAMVQAAQAHAQLLDTDRRKNEFLAALGHELRNPIGAIANAANLLARLPEPDPAKARMHALLVRQSRQVARLLDDLLDVARVTHGKLALHRAPLRLDLLAARIAGDLAAGAQRQDLQLAVDAPQPVVVEGDEARLAQVLTNLLDNAIKYTPAQGRITVAVGADGTQALLSVRDTGVGIPAELLPRVFEPFAQDPQGIERSRGGLGLGLAIVQRLVALHGGRITACSDGPGQGAMFELRLPLAAPAVAPA